MRLLTYCSSLPERLIRSTACVVGGISCLLTEALVPERVKATFLYRMMVAKPQQFLLENVAGVRLRSLEDKERNRAPDQAERQQALEPGTASAAPEPPGVDFPRDQYLERKIAGNFLELAGILLLRCSPLWIFAFFSDALSGGKAAMSRLAEELSREGIQVSEESLSSLEGMMSAGESVSKRLAILIDTPPLSKEELTQTLDDLQHHHKEILSKVKGLWEKVRETSESSHLSLLETMGILAFEAQRKIRQSRKGARAVVRTAGGLTLDFLMSSYQETLSRLKDPRYRKHLYLRVLRILLVAPRWFHPGKKTSTDRVLSSARGR